MEYTVEHETVYRYPRSVTESYTVVHLQPRTNLRQYCTGYVLDVTPQCRVFSYVDRFGNDVQHFAIVPEHNELRIVARSHVVTLPAGAVTAPQDVDAAQLDADPRTPELAEFRGTTPYVRIDDSVARLAREVPAPDDDLAGYFLAAGSFIHHTFRYRPGTTDVRTTVADVVAARAGVCQDFAHVLIALARSRGIPARYASGYIFRGVAGTLGADASHAWAEAFLPPYGWVGFDPTNDRLIDDGFVLVALGRDYGDVSPTRGLYRGAEAATLSVAVAVGAAGTAAETGGQQQQQQQSQTGSQSQSQSQSQRL
ncbi:MAG: transglutaminase family protein [Candidatus Eremiobacteraeota bacterium]|nr:transglutaminase family protein [Candidatus Eremiobacteraeota bacterium]